MIAYIEIINMDNTRKTYRILDYNDRNNLLSKELREYKKMGIIKSFKLLAYEINDFTGGVNI